MRSKPASMSGVITSEHPAPLVSVIIPAYNAERFILEAIHSVLEQNYNPIEILLIDDGSQDDTVALVEREAPQVCIIRQANGGASAARNTGLRQAKGDFICFLDADDGWFPGKLTAQVEYLLQHPEIGVVYHKWYVWKPDSEGVYLHPGILADSGPEEIDPALSGWIYTQLLFDCVVHTSTVMMRREVARDIGFFDTALTTGEDYDYWLRVSRKYKIYKLTKSYSYYRLGPGSLTSTPRAVNNEYNVLVRAIEAWGLSSPDGTSVSRHTVNQRLGKLAFDFGYMHYHSGSVSVARSAFFRALGHQPFRLRTMIYIVASIVTSTLHSVMRVDK